jgi:hypothetical protein
MEVAGLEVVAMVEGEEVLEVVAMAEGEAGLEVVAMVEDEEVLVVVAMAEAEVVLVAEGSVVEMEEEEMAVGVEEEAMRGHIGRDC